ncbi:hypothetical protein R5R73_08500 [Salinicola sp. LHM]|jgi:hypothetical protein|uniref:hypothetical protein n=1 Tax=Salinicola TaxID=404432 RepID=UPI00130051BE|nr:MULTISPECIES: hypothetical protein [Salinicola]MDF3919906.1 hypothetical protein [Salinicola salarius]MEC8918959.1 hypothetical protein [Pseudomonadota bacterium]WQH34706.1 hypothetical protein R5R73_08500 [Salinicola sp. LHM]
MTDWSDFHQFVVNAEAAGEWHDRCAGCPNGYPQKVWMIESPPSQEAMRGLIVAQFIVT